MEENYKDANFMGQKKKPGIPKAGVDLPHVWGVWMSTDDCEAHGSASISCSKSLSQE